jgi:uncharacterized protein YbjT (DUF2867 family)
MNAPLLVTGGTGNIGSRVVPMLREAGRDIRILSRHPRTAEPGIQHVAGDTVAGRGLAAARRRDHGQAGDRRHHRRAADDPAGARRSPSLGTALWRGGARAATKIPPDSGSSSCTANTSGSRTWNNERSALVRSVRRCPPQML